MFIDVFFFSLTCKYLIKDVTINRDRFDAWVELALIKSSQALDEYLEQVKFKKIFQKKLLKN
jgi:hypothetical protein